MAAMEAAKGVFAAVWMASRAAWWGKMVVGGVFRVEVLVVFAAGRESCETGIGRVEDGQIFWILSSVVGLSDEVSSMELVVCMVYRLVP